MSDWENNEEIALFREYLRIPSVHPDVDYEPCVQFLQKQAADLNLAVSIYFPGGPNKPILILTWQGQEPNLPSVVLNSHMDVVPVFEEKWTHPPFAAEMDKSGRIFARGSQDMKCVGMQYLAAIRALKRSGVTLKRTLHLMFVPDEEIGGTLGVGEFVKCENFKKLNIGFSLDEGLASADEIYSVYYAERSIWHVHFKINGNAGHGSLLLKNTVGEKFHKLLNKMMSLRKNESERLENNSNLFIGDVTTINLTCVNSGVQSNVIPPSLTAVFDIRLAITVDHVEFENQLRMFCEEAGGGIEIYFEQKQPKVLPTKIDDSNPYWQAFKKATEELGLKIRTYVFPGGTDSRYFRHMGIPAIEPCIEFLCNQAKTLNLPWSIHYGKYDLRKPLLIITLEGTEPVLPAILLNSHMDVVPVFEENWNYDPFGAEIDTKGRIFARGSQDMKCVGMQYLGAIRKLKKMGIKLRRTLHVCFVPDEEIGGILGMHEFVKTNEFEALNIAFALDEGIASPTETFVAFYAEKTLWQIKFKIFGKAGHGSLLLENTAGQKLDYIMNRVFNLRKSESIRMEQHALDDGDVTTINLTQITGGTQNNVLPTLIEATFDLRIAVDVDIADLEANLLEWCLSAGGDIEMEWVTRIDTAPATKHDMSDKFWSSFKRATEKMKMEVKPKVFCGGTDSQFLRAMGIPAIGFSPINNTPILLHDHNEYLEANIYLRGIDIYVQILQELGNTN